MKLSEINKLSKNKKISHCYIRKNGYYYRPNSRGYSDKPIDAGVYEKEVAIQHATSCTDLVLIPINIQEHNTMIIEEAKSLLERIIK